MYLYREALNPLLTPPARLIEDGLVLASKELPVAKPKSNREIPARPKVEPPPPLFLSLPTRPMDDNNTSPLGEAVEGVNAKKGEREELGAEN